MSAGITSVQTHEMTQHFPIRAGQPDIQFTVLFRSNEARQKFQSFVRKHQVNARNDIEGEVTLWWPERNIENWAGYIMDMQVAEKRFVYAPSLQFGVTLVTSLLSERTRLFSSGSAIDAILGKQNPILPSENAYQTGTGQDGMLKLPTSPSGGVGGGGLASVSGTGTGGIR